jgi:hypothetical protein
MAACALRVAVRGARQSCHGCHVRGDNQDGLGVNLDG